MAASHTNHPFKTTKIKLRPKYGENIVYCQSPSGSIPVRTPVLDEQLSRSSMKFVPSRSQTFERIQVWRVQCMALERSKSTADGNKIGPVKKEERQKQTKKGYNLLENEIDLSTCPPLTVAGKIQGPIDSHRKKEREYVFKTFLPDPTKDSFPNKILKRFFKPPRGDGAGYGMPRPFTRELTEENKKDSQAQRRYVRVGRFPKLMEPVLCEHSTHFCEILGPSTCSKCIERTNRVISDEIQTRMFAKTEIDQTSLVVPNLSKILNSKYQILSE